MPVKLRRAKSKTHRITREAVAAYIAGDYIALHLALGLRPWQMSPLPLAIEPLGCDPNDPPPASHGDASFESWPLACELQRALQAVVAR